jgi:hypothetical protein
MSQEEITSCRRQSERTSARTQVLVHCRGRFQRAKVADYSHTVAAGARRYLQADPV